MHNSKQYSHHQGKIHYYITIHQSYTRSIIINWQCQKTTQLN